MGIDTLANEPIRQRFTAAFASVGKYFNLANQGSGITFVDIATYGADRPRVSLDTTLKQKGLTSLPRGLRLNVNATDQIQGRQRSDDVLRFEQTRPDGTRILFNQFSSRGPENVDMTWNYADLTTGETVYGILTKDGVILLEIQTGNDTYYLQMQRAKVNR